MGIVKESRASECVQRRAKERPPGVVCSRHNDGVASDVRTISEIASFFHEVGVDAPFSPIDIQGGEIANVHPDTSEAPFSRRRKWVFYRLTLSPATPSRTWTILPSPTIFSSRPRHSTRRPTSPTHQMPKFSRSRSGSNQKYFCSTRSLSQ